MRFIVMVKATKEHEAGALPDARLLAEMGKFNEEMAKAGLLVSGEGLRPSSKGTRVSFGAGKPSVVDGPFAETKELIGGFWILQAKTHEEVVEWMRRCPLDHGEVEIRQLAEMADFAPSDPTGKLMENERKLRESLGSKP